MASAEHHLPAKTAESPFSTDKYGDFIIRIYESEGKEHAVLVKGNVHGQKNVPVRITSSCVTGTALHSKNCECKQQLDRSFKIIKKRGVGVIMYMDEEGRGLGLGPKINIYAQQGVDTFTAAENLGLPKDARDYLDAAAILKELGVKSIELITNNPAKVAGLQSAGITTSGIIPVEIRATSATREYLKAKRGIGHIFRQRL